MAILSKITVTPAATTTVSLVRVSGGLVPANQVNPVSVVSAVGGSSSTRFDQLLDVVEGTPANGDIVVYNAATDQYILRSLSNTSATLDGGTY